MTTPALLEVAHGAAADVRLGHLLHVDRREHPRVGAVALERLLHGERVQHGREHPHVVAGRAVHALGRRRHAAVDVAAADHERDLEPARAHVDELARERRRRSCASRPYSRRAHQGLAGELQQDALERRTAGCASADRVPGVVEQLDAVLGQVLADRRRRLVGAVPRLLGQHGLAEEPLVQLALDDLLAHVLRLREHLVRVREDLALGVDELLRHLVARAVRRPGEGQVQREAARRLAGRRPSCARARRPCSPARGRRCDRCSPSRRLHALRADDLDVLAELRGERRRAPPRASPASPPLEHGPRAPSPRRRGSRRCSRRARSRSRSRRSRRRSSRTITPTLPSLVARSARFAADAMPLSRSSLTASSKSPSVSWSARLQSIIPALVASRSSFTIAAVMSVTRSSSVVGLGSAAAGASGGRPSRRGCRRG